MRWPHALCFGALAAAFGMDLGAGLVDASILGLALAGLLRIAKRPVGCAPRQLPDLPDVLIHLSRLAPIDGGGWLATSPQLPGCMGDGDTAEAAVTDFRSAATAWREPAPALGRTA